MPKGTLGERWGNERLLELVGEEDAVQMIDFVLEDDGGEAGNVLANLAWLVSAVAVDIGIYDGDVLIAKDIAPFVRNRQAAFAAGLHFAAHFFDTDVRIYLDRLALLVDALDGDDAAADADLRCGESHASVAGLQSFDQLVGKFRIFGSVEVHHVEVAGAGAQYGEVVRVVSGKDSHHLGGVVDEVGFFLTHCDFDGSAAGDGSAE